MELSIVTTLYRSARYIEEFHSRITEVAEGLVSCFEIIFVNDGSPDDSLAVARAISKRDPRVKVIDLARNCGQHLALMCGLKYSAGKRVFLTDVDLEEEPENLGRFWAAMEDDPEIDVVVGELAKKTQPFWKGATSDLFYKIFNLLSNVRLSDRDIVARLMNRGYVDALTQYAEREIFFPGVWAHAGFRQKRVLATKTFDGNSSYTFRKKLSMAVEAVTSFSSRPLVLIFYFGLLFSTGASVAIVYLLVRRLVWGHVFIGWTSLMAALFMIGGIIIFALGIVGIYVSKIYEEVKGRPVAIVRRVYQERG